MTQRKHRHRTVTVREMGVNDIPSEAQRRLRGGPAPNYGKRSQNGGARGNRCRNNFHPATGNPS
ncbi:MAG: hypothetical protein Q8S00_22565 [Deltaproteobacteria bacterium]|nr:hypothetical protein [Deltaproteobacteria bacterium]MDZ4346046.1 hypothetical protein [Candidatus Binatia bacterium]